MASAGAATDNVSIAKVFVSYAREDKEFARQLFMALEDKGFGPLMDVRAIVPGEPWQLRLLNLIEQSTTVVIVLTDSYIASPNCDWEVKAAEERGKRMLCVLPQKLKDGGKVPDSLAKDQHIFFYADSEVPDSGFYDGVRKLEIGLRQNLDWLTLQRRYELLAETWKSDPEDGALLIGSALTEAKVWAARPPERSQVPETVAEFIAASAKAEDKRIRKARRDRVLSIAFTVLGVVLLASAVYFGVDAAQKRQDLAGAEQLAADLDSDVSTVDRAVRLWSQGQTLLNNNILNAIMEPQPATPVAQPGPAAQPAAAGAVETIAYPGVSQFIGALRELDSLTPGGATRFAALRQIVERDLARGYYHGGDAKALELIDKLLDAHAQVDASHEDASALMQHRDDLITRAIYSCLSEEGRRDPASRLKAAPESIRQLVFWTEIEPRLKRERTCADAEEAICNIAADCPYMFPSPVPAPSDEPEVEDDTPAGDKGPVDDPALFAIREVYLHIADESDRKLASVMAGLLQKEEGYRVLGIELVPSKSGGNRSVRYFYAQQRDPAEKLIRRIEALAADNGLPQWADGYRLVSLAGRYEGLPPNRVEIWF